MDLSKKLKEQGWYLTEDGIKKVIAAAAPGSETDVRKIIATAMDMDFREIAGGALPTKREDGLQGKIVLQVQKIRNISAPKANEESKAAPRFLQLDLTDGHTMMQALELEPIAALSLNVPPGTKIYFRADRLQVMSGFIILKASDVQCLGGRVEALVEKWELARTMLKYARAGRRMSGASGPPPWIAFGKKMETTLPNDRNFKSLQAGAEKDKDSKENEEFNTMRSEAIAEATKAGAKKVFGGGGQQIIDHNVKKILEKGYSEEDAKQALRTTNNNLERALYNLKRRQEYNRNDDDVRTTQTNATVPTKPGRAGFTERDTRSGGKRGVASFKDEVVAAKPAGNVSLFDFLTDKLPVSDTTTTTTSNPPANSKSNSYSNASNKFDKSKSDFGKGSYNSASNAPQESSSRPKFENNISSSFAANRTTGAPQRGGRGGSSGGERSERDSYNANERSSNSSRYGNARGGGRGGGRGGSNSGSYQSTSGRGSHEESGNTKYSNDRNAPRSSNSNYNQNASGDGGRSNRGSHERSTVPQESSGTTGGYNSRRGGGSDRGGAGERYGNYNENKSRYNQRDNNARNYDGNRQQSNSSTNTNNNSNNNTAKSTTSNTSTNNNDHAARMNKLVESTSKIKIDKNREQSGARQNSQQQPQQKQQQQQQYSPPQTQTASQPQQQPTVISHQQQQQHFAPPHNSQQQHQQQQQQQYMQAQQNNFTQLPNGFTYDPSKIIGFQSKETNEFAMTLLKSQGMTALAPQQQQQVPPPHAYVPATSPMQPPSPYGTPTTFVMPNPQAAAPPPAHFGMIPGDAWMWKIGDLCLAKYWDDGRYYEAEITAVSDKTCVVFFLGYGNHEEVLKTDCLPITDANHRPINNYNQQAASQQQQQQQQAAAAAAVNQMQSNVFQRGGVGGPGNGGGGGGSTRYRGERQMYVPPHKRDN